ncbi:uncharacterized protein LOC125758838 [Rhipicephalus sanguineus]|uniref:uncharacterized protein LOC125758838 n=1 Tax=Rhipicephalus sanguineus TaxID=34632 RepID=UPI0020C50FDF|nr:uncharacterized protein LOC125758838 [Rhipicephalus sanguineus]
MTGFTVPQPLSSNIVGNSVPLVSDWGAVQNKSMRVRLDVAPRPLVSPLAVTLLEGQPLELSCLSPHAGGMGPLGFRGLRNERLLPPRPRAYRGPLPGRLASRLGRGQVLGHLHLRGDRPLGFGSRRRVRHGARSTCVYGSVSSRGVARCPVAAHSSPLRDVQACPTADVCGGPAGAPLSTLARPSGQACGEPGFLRVHRCEAGTTPVEGKWHCLQSSSSSS